MEGIFSNNLPFLGWVFWPTKRTRGLEHHIFYIFDGYSILKIFGPMDVKTTPNFCSRRNILNFLFLSSLLLQSKTLHPMLVKYDHCEFLENTGFCIHTNAIHCDCPTYTVIIRTVHTAIITIYLHHHFSPKSFI